MPTRRKTQPTEYPPELAALIEQAQEQPPAARAVWLVDALCAEVALRDYLVPEGTERDLTAWLAEWKRFKQWATTDLSDPMPPLPHMIEGKLRGQGMDFAQTAKGKGRQGGRRHRDRTASDAEIDAYLDDLFAMPEHRHCGWTFALRLMRILGRGSNYPEFKVRFALAQERAGVTSKRAVRTKSEPEPEPETPPEPEKPKRSRARKANAA